MSVSHVHANTVARCDIGADHADLGVPGHAAGADAGDAVDHVLGACRHRRAVHLSALSRQAAPAHPAEHSRWRRADHHRLRDRAYCRQPDYRAIVRPRPRQPGGRARQDAGIRVRSRPRADPGGDRLWASRGHRPEGNAADLGDRSAVADGDREHRQGHHFVTAR